MNPRNRFPGLQIYADPDYEFAAAWFSIYAVQPELERPEDQQAFKEQRKAGVEVARRVLRKNGYRDSVSGDLAQTSEDCISELVISLRNVEARARQICGTDELSLPQFFDRIKLMTSVSADRDDLLKLAGERTDDDALEMTSGAFVLSGMRDLWGRLLQHTHQEFNQKARPWTDALISEVLESAHRRIKSYTIKALTNACISKIRAPEHSKTRLLRAEDDQILLELDYEARDTRVLSPHVRAVVMKACRRALEEAGNWPCATPREARNLNYLRALVSSVSLLLDAPDEKPYVLARSFLSPEELDPKEFKRGFMAATRHPIYQTLCERIKEGIEWH